MNVFIIEDSPTITLILQKTLKSYGYITYMFKSSSFSLDSIKTKNCDFFLINTTLENLDSSDLCKDIRESFPSSYIMGINHKGSWRDRLSILNTGADDCISYPFPPEEILIRMQVLLRRPKTETKSKLSFGKFLIDPHTQEVFYDDQKMNLSKKEYHILEYLIRNSDRCISRSELMDHVWDYRRSYGSNTVDVHINRLRKKIKDIKKEYYPKTEENILNDTEINTVHGVGYKMDGNFIDDLKSNQSS